MTNCFLRKLYALLPILCLLNAPSLIADEGMWLPQLLRQLNESDMRLKGLLISAADIYSTDNVSLKDAVVLFGGGCTGEIISNKGLLLTNHHCGFGQIQEHSTLEKNYLRDGFWAMELKDELPCPGLSVTFIVKIEDVTAQFSSVLPDSLNETKRNEVIKTKAAEIEKAASSGGYQAKVRQFFSGNEFYLITTETFNDVRMVGAPPSSIGKFGGDTDNWMWPRHTGDFSLFRIYADKNNKSAAYSRENIPYTPRKFFSISLKGVQENDFTMVYGFPGRTQEYISSAAVETLISVTNPDKITARDERLAIIGDAMRSSEALHLMYADKQSGISNGWKKMRGESKGLIESKAVEKKKAYEKQFQQWATSSSELNSLYGNLLPQLTNLYASNTAYLIANDFYNEAAFAPEIISYAREYRKLVDAINAKDTAEIRNQKESLSSSCSAYFREYDRATDQRLTETMLALFNMRVPDSLKPAAFMDIRTRYKSNFSLFAADLFKKSFLVDSMSVREFLRLSPVAMKKQLLKDPAFKISDLLYKYYAEKILPITTAFSQSVSKLNRNFMAGQRAFEPQRKFYPDANSTLRVTYGVVKGYEPHDGAYYQFQTYLDGVMEKYKKGDEEFDVPQKLVDLYQAKDYGRYGVNGRQPVSFIATNHTTGGNSGSPVLNAKGELIGTNYDRVWEGTMSDVSYNPNICRNVTLDIRYTLFIIDKFANDQRLIQEMKITE